MLKRYFPFLAICVMLSSSAWAQLTIFDMRKNLPMSDNDKVYRDFYINGGTESGISRGMMITVHRRLPLYDNYLNRSAGDLDVKVAKIKIIHVQKGLSVARVVSDFDRASTPLLEDNFIMIGDALDLATAVPDKNDKSAADEPEPKKDVAALTNPPPPPAPAAEAPAPATPVTTPAPQ